jgi:hypothetical protein
VKLLTSGEMNSRLLHRGIGYVLLWNSIIIDVLGVPPHTRAPELRWTEEQFYEICKRLRDLVDKAIKEHEDDEL